MADSPPQPSLVPFPERFAPGRTFTDLEHNRVVEGDCRAVLRALPAGSVDMIFADPPYFLQLKNELRRPDQSVVDAVKDDWDQFQGFGDYDAFLRDWLAECQRVLRDSGTLWVIGTYHNIFRVGAALQDLGFWILNSIIWEKNNPTPQFRGVRFCNAHEELIWAARTEKQAKGYTFNYQDLKAANGGKQMRSVWRYPVCTGDARKKGGDGKKLHTTEKPLALLERIVTAATRPGELVLDPFAGTGTTGEACLRLGRRFFLVEREPAYIEYGVMPRLFRAEMELAAAQKREAAARATAVQR